MTLQEKDEYKFKELHCGNCTKFMGYINSNHQNFPHDFFCSLKCLQDWSEKSKITNIQMEKLKHKNE